MSINHSLIIPNCCRFSLQFLTVRPPLNHYYNKVKLVPLISCKMHSHGHGSFDPKSGHHHPHDDFIQASLLFSETVKHHHLRKQGFQEEVNQFSGQFVPLTAQVKDFRAQVNSIGLAILRRFQNPTIFLKISCEGDFLLPIIVGEHAVDNLIDSVDEGADGEYSNPFQFLRNLVVELGYEVKMVKITKRVVNTYFARVYFGKAPIYVNKQIVLTDAIKIAYGTGRVRDTKAVYDVLLDSPMEGPDLLVEELNLVQNMKLAVKEERYIDAAMWRDKLAKLRGPGP